MDGLKKKELLSELEKIRKPRSTPINTENIRRKRGGFGFCLELKGDITDKDGHPETGGFPMLQNSHENTFHN